MRRQAERFKHTVTFRKQEMQNIYYLLPYRKLHKILFKLIIQSGEIDYIEKCENYLSVITWMSSVLWWVVDKSKKNLNRK